MKLKEIIEKYEFPLEAQVTFPGDNVFLKTGARLALISFDEKTALAQEPGSHEFISVPYQKSPNKTKAGLDGVKALVEEPEFVVIKGELKRRD